MPRTAAQTSQFREQRRQHLLLAAQRVFSRKGFHAANVADVAAEADVSQGTVYHYFESKDELLLEVFTKWETDSLQQEIATILRGATSCAEKLDRLAEAATRRLASSIQLLEASVEFWSHIPRNATIRRGFKRMFEQMTIDVSRIIQQGVDSGEFRAIDATAMARLVIATYDGLVLQWLADKKAFDWQASTRTLTTVMLQGLMATNTNPQQYD